MTLIVLGIDALDTALAKEWDVFNLPTWGKMESVAYKYDDRPYTGDVWPTIATGLHPQEHGITDDTGWDNPFIKIGSRIYNALNLNIAQEELESVAESVDGGWQLPEWDGDHVFSKRDRFVHNWPGIEYSEGIGRVWNIMDETVHSDEPYDKAEFDRRIRQETAAKLEWIRAGINSDVSVLGTHIHALDAFGHAYSEDPEHLREHYEWVDELVRRIIDKNPGETLVLSDHGMETVIKKEQPKTGRHSWRAYSGSTLSTRPQSVFDVQDWINRHAPAVERSGDKVELPEDRLRDLGYIK